MYKWQLTKTQVCVPLVLVKQFGESLEKPSLQPSRQIYKKQPDASNSALGKELEVKEGIHVMRQAFEEPDSEGVLLVDATNAFNTLN